MEGIAAAIGDHRHIGGGALPMRFDGQMVVSQSFPLAEISSPLDAVMQRGLQIAGNRSSHFD